MPVTYLNLDWNINGIGKDDLALPTDNSDYVITLGNISVSVSNLKILTNNNVIPYTLVDSNMFSFQVPDVPTIWDGLLCFGILEADVTYGSSLPIVETLQFGLTYTEPEPPGPSGPTGSSEPVPCITAGQRILTPDGYKLIEELKTGDLITTPDKRDVKVKVYQFTLRRTDEETAPIVIPSNFFYHSYPPNEITLSPYHRIQIREGEWIEPKKLNKINPEVKQIKLGEEVTYYHVKTPNFFKDHLVVEGCIVESFLEGEF